MADRRPIVIVSGQQRELPLVDWLLAVGYKGNSLLIGAGAGGSSVIGNDNVTLGNYPADSFIVIQKTVTNQWHAHPNDLTLDTTGKICVGDGPNVPNFANGTRLQVWEDDPAGGSIILHTHGGPISVGDYDALGNSTLLEVDDTLSRIKLTATNIDLGTVTDGVWNGTAIDYANLQDVSAASKLLGRGSAGGAGDIQEITLGTGLSMSGTTLNGYGGMAIGNAVSGGAANRVLYEDSSQNLAADADFTFDAANTFLKVNDNATGSVKIGAYPGLPSFGGIWIGQSSPSGTNYALIGNGGSTFFNAPTGGSVVFRINNADTMTVNNLGLVMAAAKTLTAASGNLIVGSHLELSTKNLVTDTTTGTKIGTGATQKLGFWGVTPVTQRSDITGLTDSTGGTIAVGVLGDTGNSTINNNFALVHQAVMELKQILLDIGITA